MRDTVDYPRRHWLLNALFAVTPVAVAAVLGNLATIPNIPGWYAGLIKPAFSPPNWIFGPVWAVLYVMIAYAFFRVLHAPRFMPGRSGAIALFIVQMALNASWSWAFFAARNPGAGVAVIAAMWLAIVLTLLAFRRVDGLASLCLAPYLAWVSFAAVLNVAIWRLNS